MKVAYPESMQEFMDQFSNDEACRQYLMDVRWVDGFQCPYCAHTETWKHARGILRCKKCRRDVSVISGTVFAKSHLSLRLWFQALWLVVSQKNGVSSLGLARALGIREKTGWNLLRKIRTAMVRTGRERLSGLVEVDEVFIGGIKPGKRGRGACGKVLILVAVENKEESGIGRIRITIISDATSTSLITAIESMIEPGSTIRTDGWKSYSAITKHNYKHTVMEKQATEPGDDPTPLVHRIAALVKRWLLGTHHGRVDEVHLNTYLNEFVFRFNRRQSRSRGKLFHRLVQGMVRVKHD